jgi:N-acetylmuramoyl-L-alanine amidase
MINATRPPGDPPPRSLVQPAAEGWRLNLGAKSPLVLPRLQPEGPAWYPVKEAVLYLGCSVTWRSSARLLEMTGPSGAKARLVLGEPFLFEALTRTALSAAPQLVRGTPALPEADLRLLLSRLGNQPPSWEPASPAELADAVPRVRGIEDVIPEPAMEPTVEPQIALTPGTMVAARPLSGGKLRTIVLDAGHGGHDPGAHGPRGLKEKDVCLDIARRVKTELSRLAPDLVVVMTRDRDEFLSLRERTEISNKLNADLFVSIHNNAARNARSHGSQVFFYDNATSDRAAADLVARENEDVNELEVLLTDLAKGLVRDQSIGLASRMQADLGTALKLKHRDLSFAPFYVLARTKMPAVLVEVAFITNRDEERLLADPVWRQQVALSMARGLLSYRRQVEGNKP